MQQRINALPYTIQFLRTTCLQWRNVVRYKRGTVIILYAVEWLVVKESHRYIENLTNKRATQHSVCNPDRSTCLCRSCGW